MTDPFAVGEPFALLPFALSGAGGSVNGIPASQLVAAGVTLLQRHAPLVRALAGRRAAILLPTGPAFLTALGAAEGRGAVLVNPLAAPPEIAHQLADAKVGAVLTTSAFASRLPAHLVQVHLDDAPRTARVIVDGSARDVDLGSHVGLPLAGEAGVAGRDEEAVVVYTSAMAGVPLGAILTHRNLLANGHATVVAAANVADDHVLALLPFSHLFGLVVTAVAPLLAGARVHAPERFHPVRAVEAIEAEDITEVVGVPAVFLALLAAIERRGAPLRAPHLRLCICGGAPLSLDLQERWAEATGVELRQGYGLTEGGPVCLFNRVDLPNRRGTLGRPFPGVSVEIREPATGLSCPTGSIGEIVVRGANVSPGYVSGGEHGLRREDGWLETGDLGRASEDGTVTFAGVRKAMFTRNGFNIYPRELEIAVEELPGVHGVRAYGIPSVEREHDIRLEVTGSVTEDAIRQWCQQRLSVYKQPTEVVVAAG